MRFNRLRLGTQLLIVVVGTALLAIILLATLAIFLTSQVVRDEGDQRLVALAEATGELVAAPLAAGDTAEVERTLAAVVREEGFDRAFLFGPDGTLVANQLSDRVEASDLSDDDQAFALDAQRAGELRSRDDSDNLIDIAVPLVANGNAGGVLLAQASNGGAVDEIVGTALPQMIAAALLVAVLAAAVALGLARYTAAPLRKLTNQAIAVGQGRLEAMPNVQGSEEISTLSGAFDQMINDLSASQALVAEQQRLLETRVEERTADLEQALAELRESVDARNQLSATVRDLASPVVPVLDGIVVMPLIGVIDSDRAALLIETLLRAIEHHRARAAILDVTGVPIIDAQVARTLLDTAQAVKLLGAQTILVGLRPELAQTIVSLGLDLSLLLTQADLQSGVSYALRQQQR